jgi:hypothetical protein
MADAACCSYPVEYGQAVTGCASFDLSARDPAKRDPWDAPRPELSDNVRQLAESRVAGLAYLNSLHAAGASDAELSAAAKNMTKKRSPTCCIYRELPF